MRRLLLVLTLLAVLFVAVGCTTDTQTDGEGDGLHSTVPDVIGLAEADARTAIDEAGYEVGSVLLDAESDAEPGTVVDQNPVAGTSVARGSSVELTLAGE